MENTREAYSRYFLDQVGVDWNRLVAAIPGGNPAGIPAAEDARFRRIRHEREEEDASLPLGPWERELKRANWVAASELSAQTLASSSKDLQLAAWLCEALIARTGFEALAPCLALIDALFQHYREQLHPMDREHRINLLQWIGGKLLPPLRRVPLTATGEAREFCWNDWEQAQHNEQLRASQGKNAALEGATLQDVGAALACTPDERIVFLQAGLHSGLHALAELDVTLNVQMEGEAPGFGAIRQLLERIEVVLAAEARRRGMATPVEEDDEDPQPADQTPRARADNDSGPALPERREVYAALSRIAHALERIEPHSPVPYLIRRAVAWGGLNTAELYHEVFMRCGGQINIFELLGLEETPAGAGE